MKILGTPSCSERPISPAACRERARRAARLFSLRLAPATIARVLLFAMTLFWTPASALQSADTVLLGMNYPLTGAYSVEGLDQIRAARLATDEINALGGVLGKRVELRTRDSASDALITRLNVTELIAEGCKMIFGGSSSAVAIAAGEVCARRNTLFFGTLTYSTATTLEYGRGVTFRECYDSRMAARVMAEWLNSRYAGKRYFYITADYTWGWTTEECMREATGTVNRDKHPSLLKPLGSTDFSEELRQAARFNPDVLVLVLFGKDMAYALRQATDMGLKSRCQIVAPNLTLGMAERAGPKAMEGVVGATPWTWKAPALVGSQRGQAFVDAFVKRYRRYPSTSGASAYTIVYEYKAAVEAAGSFKTKAVIEKLEGRTYTLLKDAQTWRALDHQSVQTVFMVQGNSPQAVLADPLRLDYFTIIAQLPGEQAVISEEDWKALRIKAKLPLRLEYSDE